MIAVQVDEQTANKPKPVIALHEPPDHRPRASGGCGPWAIVAIVAAVVVIGVGAYLIVTRVMGSKAAAGAAAAGKGGPVPVVVAEAIRGDMPVYLTGLGTITAYNTASIRTRVDGQIMLIAFTEGQFVKEGQLLVQIDPRPYQVQLAQAQGQLEKDQAQLQNAQADLGRFLSIPNSVTQQQVETQKALVNQFVGVIESDKSQVDSAKLNMTYCNITAPITGRIGLRLVDVGNIIHASDTSALAVITQLQPIALVFTVTQDQVAQVFERPDHGDALPVEAFNRDFTQKIATGKLLAIDNQVDPSTATVRIKAEFANQNNALFPNEFVNARLLVDTLKGIVIVPSAAVQLGPQNTFVYVVKADNTVELRVIKTGHREGSQTEIDDGLKPGEKVVTDGVDKLTQGSKVVPRAAAAAPGDQSTTRPARGGATRPARDGASTQSGGSPRHAAGGDAQ